MERKVTTGEKLRELRGEKSKKEVSEAIGISESSYIKYERNERVPRDSVKEKIARFFNSSVEAIFFA